MGQRACIYSHWPVVRFALFYQRQKPWRQEAIAKNPSMTAQSFEFKKQIFRMSLEYDLICTLWHCDRATIRFTPTSTIIFCNTYILDSSRRWIMINSMLCIPIPYCFCRRIPLSSSRPITLANFPKTGLRHTYATQPYNKQVPDVHIKSFVHALYSSSTTTDYNSPGIWFDTHTTTQRPGYHSVYPSYYDNLL